MQVIHSASIQKLIRICAAMYRLGWDERNGGNISMLLAEKELEDMALAGSGRVIDLGFDASALAGKVLAVTGTGKYFRNVEYAPEENLGILKIHADGKSAALLWGFSDGGRQTSEFAAHARSHSARLKQDPRHQVVMHCHATNTLAMTYLHSLNERDFTRTLWKMSTECIVVFPEGVGILPWMLCGTDEIGRATALKMETRRLCIWAQHGIFAAGQTLDEAFGLIETVEKAAEIFVKIAGRPLVNTIDDGQLRLLAEAFNVDYRRDYLDDTNKGELSLQTRERFFSQ